MADQKRIDWIDRLRGIAFFFVVLGHVYTPESVNAFIYSFHMPLFFFISGLTLNADKLIRTPMKQIFMNNLKRLIIPYLWLNFMMFPLWVLTYKFIATAKSSVPRVFFGIFYGNGNNFSTPSNALWFLLCLFFANLLIAVILKLFKNDFSKVGTAVALLALVGYFDRDKDYIWHLNTPFTAIVFIFLGYAFMQYYKANEEKFRDVCKKKYIGIIAALLFCGFVASMLNGRMSINSNHFGKSLWLFYLGAIVGTLAITLIVLRLPKITAFDFIGKNTLLYLAIHAPIIRLFEKLCPLALEKVYISVPFAIFLYFAIMPICLIFNKYFPFAVGKITPVENSKFLKFSGSVFVAECLAVPFFYLIYKLCPTLLNGITLLIPIAVLLILSAVITLILYRFFKILFLIDNKPIAKVKL